MNRAQKRAIGREFAVGKPSIELERMVMNAIDPCNTDTPPICRSLDAVKAAMALHVRDIEKIEIEVTGAFAYCELVTKRGRFRGEGRSETMARASAMVNAIDADPIVIKGVGFAAKGGGFAAKGGGFAALEIEGKTYTLEQIASALGL
jgi:hypothetical protein